MPSFKTVLQPNFGLYYDRPSLVTPARAVTDGMNFRVKNGKLNNLNLGWERFSPNWQLNGPVTFIDNFFPRGSDERLLFGTTKDIYVYDPTNDSVKFLTPRYEAGTASASGTTVTGTGTTWSTNAKINDEIAFGATGVKDPNATWHTIANVVGNTTLTLAATAGVVASGPYTIRKTFSGSVDDTWSFDTFVQDSVSGDDLWIATNGIEPVISWNGITDQMTQNTGFNFTCKVVAVFSNMCIYGNITQGSDFLPTSIINSDIGKPLDVVGGLASQFRVHDGTDEILNMAPLGDNLVIYAERHLVPVQFVGDPLVFLFRSAISGLGPISHNGIADFGDFHEFVGTDAQYLFDGVSVREINAQVWREIIRTHDPIRKRRIFAHFDEENGELIWAVPLASDPGASKVTGDFTTAYPEHYLEEVEDDVATPYSKRAFPFTAAGYYERNVGLTWNTVLDDWQSFNFSWNDQFFALAFPINLVGDSAGHIYILNQAQTAADGSLLPSFVRFGRYSLGSGRERSLLQRVYPFSEKLNLTLTVTAYMTDHAAGPPTITDKQVFDTSLPEGRHFVSTFRRGRFMEIAFGTAGEPWQLWGYDIDYATGGDR